MGKGLIEHLLPEIIADEDGESENVRLTLTLPLPEGEGKVRVGVTVLFSLSYAKGTRIVAGALLVGAAVVLIAFLDDLAVLYLQQGDHLQRDRLGVLAQVGIMPVKVSKTAIG
jgi:hypothetical protein